MSRFDSRGNIIFDIADKNNGRMFKMRKRYKYDKNDSIIKEISHKMTWYYIPKHEDESWEEKDSQGNVTNYANYKISYSKKKEKWKSEKRILRDALGYPVRIEVMIDDTPCTYTDISSECDSIGKLVKYENFEIRKDDTIPESIIEHKFDELGRLVETTSKNCIAPQYNRKMVWKYHKDFEFYSYIASYNGENFVFSHESLFFYDEKGNCIAHIQWMPKSKESEYYFNVYKIGYYD